MKVTKEAYERVRQALNKELAEAQKKLAANRTHIRGLSKEQRTLKSEVGALYVMIRDLAGKPKKVNKKHNQKP